MPQVHRNIVVFPVISRSFARPVAFDVARSPDRRQSRTMSHLERAIAIAVEANRGKKDKAGQPYILHPLHVMLRVATKPE